MNITANKYFFLKKVEKKFVRNKKSDYLCTRNRNTTSIRRDGRVVDCGGLENR